VVLSQNKRLKDKLAGLQEDGDDLGGEKDLEFSDEEKGN
jgi:hypothetical protein